MYYKLNESHSFNPQTPQNMTAVNRVTRYLAGGKVASEEELRSVLTGVTNPHGCIVKWLARKSRQVLIPVNGILVKEPSDAPFRIESSTENSPNLNRQELSTKPTGKVNAEFEETISRLTQPLNGQYPRPWMTKLQNPLDANIFVVGKNQRNGYDCKTLGSHQRHMDALFNRNGESCRAIYGEMTVGKPSPTRKNTDRFVGMLESNGVDNVLETNVICYSTPMSADLQKSRHARGSRKGEEIFRFLLNAIQPKVLVVHGAGSNKKLASILNCDLDTEPQSETHIRLNKTAGMLIASIPSLAPPAYNKWSKWADRELKTLAKEISQHMRS